MRLGCLLVRRAFTLNSTLFFVMVRIQKRLVKKRYYGKAEYHYPVYSINIPKKHHKHLQPFLNQDLETTVEHKTNTLTITLTSGNEKWTNSEAVTLCMQEREQILKWEFCGYILGTAVPYKEHPTCKKPDNVNQKIWRYLKFKHFPNLVEKHVLYFARSDLLGEKFEGSITPPELDLRKKYVKHRVNLFKPFLPELTEEELLRRQSRTTRELNKGVYVNCWHMNDNENNLMWRHYPKRELVIQSTFKKLQECFTNCKEDIHIGKVMYRDLKTDISPRDNFFYKNLRKDLSLKDERELRAITFKFVDDSGIFLENAPEGIPISVNIDLLIEKIIISPFADPSLKEKIMSVIQRNNLTKKLKKSRYENEPLF